MPDQNVDLALREARHRLPLLGRRTESRDLLDRHRVVLQPLGERAEVLLGEDRRGHEQHHLLVVLRGLERSPQRDLGLAIADVAADQAVHRPRRLHVALHELDRIALVRRLGERERVLELPLPVGVERVGVALAPLALRVQVEQLAGQLLRRPPCPRLDRVPACAAELRKRRMGAAGADVAADLRQLIDRHEHPVGPRVFQIQVVPRDPGDSLGVEPCKPRDPVILVNDDIPGPQIGKAPQHPPPTLRAGIRNRPPAPEQPMLRNHRKVKLRRDEAGLKPGVGKHHRPLGGRPGPVLAGIEPAHLQTCRGCMPRAPPLRAARTRPRSGTPSGRASRARAQPP